jgi:hypothetical protein
MSMWGRKCDAACSRAEIRRQALSGSYKAIRQNAERTDELICMKARGWNTQESIAGSLLVSLNAPLARNVAQVRLQRSGVVPAIRQGVATGVPEHVWMDLESELRPNPCSLDHPSEAG